MDEQTVTVEYGGQTYRMRRFTTRDYVALRKGDMDDLAVIESVCAAVIEGPDPMDLPVEQTLELLTAWMNAMSESALPPATAARSKRPSGVRR